MTRFSARWLLLVPLAAACTVLGPMLPSGPWLTDTIRFSHDRHAKADVDCLACHETVYDAVDLFTRHLPPESKCMECHSEEKDNNNCKFCHSDARAASGWPEKATALAFNHVNHLQRTNEDCKVCHTSLPEPRVARKPMVMDTCLKCHEHEKQYREANCQSCHLDLPAEKLKPLKDYSHQGNFVLAHRTSARASSDSCMTCHAQNECIQCHNATPGIRVEVAEPQSVTRDLIHRNDFLSRHSLEARADPSQCYRCHRVETCNGCHASNNVGAAGADPRNPHPRNYVRRGGSAFHGAEARQDITRCAACHDQGASSNCVDCHKVGSIGGNPHPPGWTMDHRPSDIPSNGMCQYCHQ